MAIATENVKKEIGLLSKTTTLRVNQKFFYISLLSITARLWRENAS